MRKFRLGGAVVALGSAFFLFLYCTATAVHAGQADEIVDAPRSAHEMPGHGTRNSGSSSTPTAIDQVDATAALEGIRIALTEVGDGGSYVWHRHDGRLSGMAQPTSSFKDPAGQPCRHLIVMLNAFDRSSKVEGVACRIADGRWQLTG